MPKFSRRFPFFQVLSTVNQSGHFPTQGELLNPSEVSNDVQLTHDLFKPDCKHTMYLSGATFVQLGDGVNPISNNALIGEPLPGYVSIPQFITLFHETSVPDAIETVFSIVTTGNAADFQTGIWSSQFLNSFDLTGRLRIRISPHMFIPRGNALGVTFGTFAVPPPLNINFRSVSYWIQVPIETVNWQDARPNF